MSWNTILISVSFGVFLLWQQSSKPQGIVQHPSKSNNYFYKLVAQYFSKVKFQVSQHRIKPMKTPKPTQMQIFFQFKSDLQAYYQTETKCFRLRYMENVQCL